MVIQFRHEKVTAQAIEWSDKARENPIGFLVSCPRCEKQQWFNLKDLYVANDDTGNNYRCQHCNYGKPKRTITNRGKMSPTPFSPRSPGWKSVGLTTTSEVNFRNLVDKFPDKFRRFLDSIGIRYWD